MSIARGAVFGGFSGGVLTAIELQSGRVGWETGLASPRGSTELERVADIAGLPAVDGEQVCAASYQGRVGCLQINNGRPNWTREASSSNSVAVDTRYLYISDESGAVLAFDKRTGASVWKQDKLARRRLGAPIVAGTYVLVGDAQGYIHALARDDGAFAGRMATDGSALSAPPQAADDVVLFQTRDGGLYAVRIQ